MGSQARQLLVTLCVDLSLALFALDGTGPTSGFCLRTLSYSRPTTIVGHILDTIVISHVVVGMLYKELGRCVNMGLLRPFTVCGMGPPLCLLDSYTMGL
jgi:hypothetical protein